MWDASQKSTILVELQETMGNDRSIAEAAWTSSYDKDKKETKDEVSVERLIPHLIKQGHGTPIESVIFRFWIRMPIFTDRQHVTHRIATHNGLSGRYRTVPNDFFGIPKDGVNILEKALGTCMGKNLELEYNDHCKWCNEWYLEKIQQLKEAEKNAFISNAEFKRARELLRGVLPQSNMVERTTIMNLRSFANYQYQRNSVHAQPEIREVSRLMLKAVEESNVAPIAVATLKEIGWRI